MLENNEISLKKVSKNKRKTRKIALLFLLTGITAVLLVVETYAWFIGLTTIKVEDFQIGVSTDDSFKMSLDGEDWDTTLTISKENVITNGYEGHTNKWVDDYDASTGLGGLIPISTAGEADDTNYGRLKLFGKSSMTATGGGFRLIADPIDNKTSGEGEGYLVFDLFIRNGTGTDYIADYNRADDEAVYLTAESTVTVEKAGTVTDDYGLANSVRVAFVQIARTASAGADAGKAAELTCSSTGNEGSTSLCKEAGNVVIWEPNHDKHHASLVTYFNNVCKTKTAGEGVGSPFVYGGTDGTTACTPVKGEGSNPNTALTATSHVPTYVVSNKIKSDDKVDIYDGLNGYTGTVGGESDTLLVESETFTDADKNTTGAARKPFFYLAPNSITKIRVYIYLEGQDVDNYDLISNGSKVKINFGFTKDQWNMADTGATGDAGEES